MVRIYEKPVCCARNTMEIEALFRWKVRVRPVYTFQKYWQKFTGNVGKTKDGKQKQKWKRKKKRKYNEKKRRWKTMFI